MGGESGSGDRDNGRAFTRVLGDLFPREKGNSHE
jgi:hypothetical protein